MVFCMRFRRQGGSLECELMNWVITSSLCFDVVIDVAMRGEETRMEGLKL